MNVSDLLSISGQIVPDRDATVLADRRTSYADLDTRASALAAGLSGTGNVKPGDRAAWIDVNSDRQVEAFFGIARADAVSVPFNYRARDDELAFAIEDSGATVLFVGPKYLGAVCELLASQADRLASVETLVAIDGEPPEGWIAYEALLQDGTDPVPGRDGDDTAMILYTAGTTGRPKGVMLTHDALTAYPLENVNPADPEFAQRTLLSVPLYHVAGVQVFLSSIYGGRTLVVQPQFDAANWLKLVEQEGVTRATVVPTMLKMAIEHPDFASRDLSSLQILTYGAAPMPHDVIETAIERLPGVRFINAFGQTETGATITALPPDDHDLTGDPEVVAKRKIRLGSIGLPLDDVEVRVVDEDGEQVPVGEVGEIVARGPRLMKGYWRRDDATAETMHGGWLHTGDLGRVDGDGYVYLAGRAKDFIKRGGEMVSPEEVESVLREHASVEDAAIIGVPDAHWGESVRAVVVAVSGEVVDEDELVEHCRAKLASFKKPESIVVIDELPRNALGKVLKRELRERFGQD